MMYRVDHAMAVRAIKEEQGADAATWLDYLRDKQWWHTAYEEVPVTQIQVPEVWEPSRYNRAVEGIKANRALPPIRLSEPEEGGYLQVRDGIHRLNAAIDAGHTHVPAVVTRLRVDEPPPAIAWVEIQAEANRQEGHQVWKAIEGQIRGADPWFEVAAEEDGYQVSIDLWDAGDDIAERIAIIVNTHGKIGDGTRHAELVRGEQRITFSTFTIQELVAKIKKALPQIGGSKWHIHGPLERVIARIERTAEEPEFQTGVPVRFHYLRNLESAPDMGDRMGQHLEPSGEYVTQLAEGEAENFMRYLGPQKAGMYEYGEMSFQNPLVLDWGAGYHDGWKNALYEKYGVTGSALSLALQADGYDGVVTMQGRDASEIVNLGGTKLPAAQEPE